MVHTCSHVCLSVVCASNLNLLPICSGLYMYINYKFMYCMCASFSGDGKFGCPQTADYHPEEDFTCQEKIYNSLLTQARTHTCIYTEE